MSELAEANQGVGGVTSNREIAVHRVEIRTKEAVGDPRGRAVVADAKRLGIALESARTARIYLIRAPITADQLQEVIDRLLVNPVTESAHIGASAVADHLLEVHPLAGVMDPVANTMRCSASTRRSAPARATTSRASRTRTRTSSRSACLRTV